MSLLLQRAAHRTLGPILGRWLSSATNSLGRLPTPTDEPRVFAPGPNPDRILMMGGGVVRGNGVTSHNLGLGGHLARRLSGITGRGAEVELEWRPMMSPEGAIALLDELDLDMFDAALIILGSHEAISLLPVDDWLERLTEIVEAVRRNAPENLPVFLVGIPQIPDFLSLPSAIRARVRRRTDRLNEASEQVCLDTGRLRYLPISVAHGSLRTYGDKDTYDHWAQQFAPAVARAVDAA